jgi:MOSC domain-containing protein YiiM
MEPMRLDSESTGDPARYRTAADLARALAALAAAPADRGRVVHAVTRCEGGRREAPSRVALTPEGGVDGDSWGRRADRKPDAQVTVMQAGIAALIANGQPIELFGDNLFLDLDISAANLPPGSQVEIGEALLEVTPLPHNGCRKFKARFGEDALLFVQDPAARPRNMRGIHMRVLRGGEVGVGDEARVIRRG